MENYFMIKQVIVVRKDLNMRKGKVGAQCAHASNAILLDVLKEIKSFDNLDPFDPLYIWLNSSFTKIVVGCNSEEELILLWNKARTEGIRTSKIIDNGTTEFGGVPTLTCIAIGPDTDEQIDLITGHLRLL